MSWSIRRRTLAVLCALGFVIGCDKGSAAPSSAKHEAMVVSRAIDQLRQADATAQPELLQALRGLPCSDAGVCAVKDGCVAAYARYLDGIKMLSEARRIMSQGGAAAGASSTEETAARLLLGAEKILRESREGLDRCVSVQGKLDRDLSR